MSKRQERRAQRLAAKARAEHGLCRHGFPRATHEVSRSFRDKDGVQRWTRVTVEDMEDCPDA